MNEFENNPPEVGIILYHQRIMSTGEMEYESLDYLDSQPKEGDKGWYYSQIAMIDHAMDEKEVYLGMEAGGGLSHEGLRRATDEDVKKFVDKLINDEEEAVSMLSEWIKNIKASDKPELVQQGIMGLKKEELERLINLTKESLKQIKGESVAEEFESNLDN